MKKTIQEISEETLEIMRFISGKGPGTVLSYKEIQGATGVTMDAKGKSYLRSALRKLKIEYECTFGESITLASPKNATKIVFHRLKKVDSSVRRAEKTHGNITSNFYGQLNEHEQKRLAFIGSAFGAIRLAVKSGVLYLKEQKMQKVNNSSKPQLPEFTK